MGAMALVYPNVTIQALTRFRLGACLWSQFEQNDRSYFFPSNSSITLSALVFFGSIANAFL